MAALGTILGGLQSRNNPGRNMTPAASPYRYTGPTSWAGRTPPTSIYAGIAPVGLGGYRGSTAGVAAMSNAPTASPVATPVGPPKPPPPVAIPALPPPPTASLMSFDQWLGNNEQWSQQNAASVANRNRLMANYGWVRDANGKLVKDTTAAPDSILASLDLGLGQRKQQAAQQGSNRGALFSGGMVNEVDKATQAYEAGVAKAEQSLIDGLGAVDQQDLDTKLELDDDYDADIANTQVQNPANTIASFAGMKPDVGIASIDAYIAKYGKYLKPNELAEFKRQRDILTGKLPKPGAATPPRPTGGTARPRPTKPTKKRSTKKTRDGGIAGGAGRRRRRRK